MTKTFHCMKLVESIMVKIPALTNNLYFPRIRKKLMFCETSEQYVVTNVITYISNERLRSLFVQTDTEKRLRSLFVQTDWVCHTRVGLP